MGKYKAIISDVDGTLTPIVPQAVPSEKATKKIKELSQKGMLFSLASGRPFFLLEYLTKHLSLTTPIISDNGAVIIDGNNGSVIWEKNLPNNEAQEIINMIPEETLTRLSCDSINLENPQDVPQNVKIRKVSIHDLTHELADLLIKQVEDKFKNLAVVKSASYKSEKFADVYFSHAEATKQHAVRKYSQILNISPKEIIGIGDGYNDFSLLIACGLRVAMGNAVSELKAIADYIAPPQNEDGIIDIIDRFT